MSATETSRSSEERRRRSKQRPSLMERARRKMSFLPQMLPEWLDPFYVLDLIVFRPIRFVVDSFASLGEANRAFWRTAGELFSHYWKQRRFHYLVFGLPALVLMIGVAYFSLTFRNFDRDMVPKYEGEAKAAFAAEDYARAELLCRRLTKLGNEQLFKFMLGYAAVKLGQEERGSAIIRSLAPLDRDGYFEAHGFEALRICDDKRLAADPRNLDVAIIHLQKALKEHKLLDQRAIVWNDRLGMLYISRNRPDLAVEHLLISAQAHPDRRLILAEVYKQLGENAKAQVESEQARDHFALKIKQDPANEDARVRFSQASLLCGNQDAAVAALKEGILARPDSIPLKQALSSAYVFIARTLLSSNQIDLQYLLHLTSEAIKNDPKNAQALQLLVNISSQPGKTGEQVRELVLDMLAHGVAVPQCHLILGNYAHLSGQREKARFHFEQALQLNPESAELANNLAFALTRIEKPDLPRAMELIDSALMKQPGNASFRDTRGQILLKMGKHKEAIQDLQIALQSLPGNPGIHRGLAECYAKLGVPEMESRHKKLAIESQRKNEEFQKQVGKVLDSIDAVESTPSRGNAEPGKSQAPGTS